ncbi:TAXI family TRAP transporter solute-binding subunit [Methylobacterium durans]|uniref:TAXI family TRAP transporter solute-binding subunit n=1 Tax=Methylobacterium durans TaxID=2202825 RepID=UPI002AFE090A|nr:TAXI family TRAP transporter solute-binding subunit [Methylobacterium durans]MEA1832797.1 TAXI family TRAP transporter solute-binding subunit [Methylobacterium durans]
MPRMPISRELVFLVVAVLLSLAAGTAFYWSRASTLTIAVAPSGGTEPALLRAYAEALAARDKGVRLKVLSFDGVRESADALRKGEADLAVVRPDVSLPPNGLTLAVLREQALVVVAPEGSGIRAFPDLARRRLGVIAARNADRTLISDAVEHYGLQLREAGPGPVPAGAVTLVPVEEDDLAKALAEKRIEAVALVTTPTTPSARRIIGLVQGASRTRKVALFGVSEGPALIERFPRLQAVTVPAGLFGGKPKLPEEDVATVGASYRLMARANLSRSIAAEVTQYLFETRTALADALPAANAIHAPAYDVTAAATSARLPIHPGAIDYYEREQESFIERYETWIYLVAFLGGGVGSGLAWLRQRLSRLRRERVEVATERLLEIQAEARRPGEASRLPALAGEIDDLAAEIVRHAVDRPTEPRTISAAAMAVDAARSTVRRAAEGDAPRPKPGTKPGLRAVE